jgi:hypothetical protein
LTNVDNPYSVAKSDIPQEGAVTANALAFHFEGNGTMHWVKPGTATLKQRNHIAKLLKTKDLSDETKAKAEKFLKDPNSQKGQAMALIGAMSKFKDKEISSGDALDAAVAVAKDVAQNSNNSDNIDSQFVSGAASATEKATSNSSLPDTSEGVVYQVKSISPEQVKTTGANPQFKNLKSIFPSAVQVGDLIPKGKGAKNNVYWQVLSINGNTATVRVVSLFSDNGTVKEVNVSGFGTENSFGNNSSNYNVSNVKRPNAIKNTGYFTNPDGTPTTVTPTGVTSVSTPAAQAAAKTSTVTPIEPGTIKNTTDLNNYGVEKYGAEYYAELGFDNVDPEDGKEIPNLALQTLWSTAFKDKKVKTSDDKNVIAGNVVTDGNGNAGIITHTEQTNSGGSNSIAHVTWVTGPKAGTSEVISDSGTLYSEQSWISPAKAKALGVPDYSAEISAGADKANKNKVEFIAANKVAIEQAKIAAENKAIQDAKDAELKKLADANKISGSGTEKVVVTEPANWNSSIDPVVPSVASALNTVATDGKKAGNGMDVLIDADEIEDDKVAIHRVKKGTKTYTRLQFKLTAWTADNNSETGEKGIVAAMADDPETIQMSGMAIPRNNVSSATGVLNESPESLLKVDGSKKGRTYKKSLKDADGNVIGYVLLHRAVKGFEAPNHVSASTSSGMSLAYHNLAQVYIEGNATPEQVEAALKSFGITSARPSTKDDIKVMNENKIIALFGNKADGTKNFSGELRKKILDDVQETYGFTAEDMTPHYEAGNVVFLAPRSVGEKLAAQTNIKAFYHSWNGGGKPTTAEEWFNFITNSGLYATAKRWTQGINNKGMSSDADGYTGGADFIFMSAKTSPISSGTVFDPAEILRRFDWHVNSGDGYGTKKDHNHIQVLTGGAHEIMLKYGPSWAALSHLEVGSHIRAELLKLLTEAGITSFGERPIGEVIN